MGGDVGGVGGGGEVGGQFCRGEQGEEDEGLVVRVVGAVDRAGRNVGDFARAEDAVVGADPLFGATGDHVDDLLPVRMQVERVAVVRRHVRAHEQELLSGDQVGAAEPLIVCPSIGFTGGLGEQDETTIGGVHGEKTLSAKRRSH